MRVWGSALRFRLIIQAPCSGFLICLLPTAFVCSAPGFLFAEAPRCFLFRTCPRLLRWRDLRQIVVFRPLRCFIERHAMFGNQPFRSSQCRLTLALKRAVGRKLQQIVEAFLFLL